MKTIHKNKFLEFNFILFPIWILPVYFLMKFFFESSELPFLIFLVLFGETHFASTFLFFFNKTNSEYIKKNKSTLIYLPVILVITYFILGLNYFEFAILLGAAASGIHVTRQSIGISRLYSEKRSSFYELIIYAGSFLFLLLGFIRFYIDSYSSNLYELVPALANSINIILNLLNNNFFTIPLVIIFSLLALSERTNYKKRLVNLTGVLIYCPYLFVNNIFDAIVVGVGAHWSQYLLINYKIYFYKQNLNYNKWLQIGFIFIYALVMGLLGYKYHFNDNIIQFLILIPFAGQFFHYIVDAFIWRFSVQEIRDNIGSRLFANS
tara:strand:- start:357 stop:1322 length:966 start_codon:yes stop_codon:yes gene_type:complete